MEHMKKVEWFWNLLYYNIYLFDLMLTRWLSFVNPIYWINKIPMVKKHYKKEGINDLNKFINNLSVNAKNGTSSIVAGGSMGILLILIEIGILNILSVIVNNPLLFGEDIISSSKGIVAIALLMIPVIFLNNILLFKKERYLLYFRCFKKMSNAKKRKYAWLSLLSVLLIVFFTIASFYML